MRGGSPRLDVPRYRPSSQALTGISDKEATLIAFGRELFGTHNVTAETYAPALKIFGETDRADRVDLMALHASDAAMLTAFDQHPPAGQKELLPLP